MRKVVPALVAVATVALSVVVATRPVGHVLKAQGQAVKGQYMVTLRDDGGDVLREQRGKGNVRREFRHVLNGGFVAKLSPEAAETLAKDPRVALVEEDSVVTADNHGSWGLDRIDQRDGESLDSTYSYAFDGSGVHAYIVDSGIRGTHTEFTGRLGNGVNMTGLSGGAYADCKGHGTHVAGTVGGTKYGVAKNVTLHSVRVLDCDGSGSSSDTAAGIDWAIDNHVEPAVMNISINSTSTSVKNAVEDAISVGIVVSMSAGNDGINSCSSSRVNNTVPAVLNVGSFTSSDAKSSFSNYGPCVDIWAPGSSIVSASHTSDTGSATMSGTSMATPHVTGVAALYLDQFGDAGMAEVHGAIVADATLDELSSLGTGSIDRALYSFFPSVTTTTTAPTTTTTTTAPSGGSVFFDDFETDRGWTVDPHDTDSATTGAWERGDPEPTASSGGPKQLEAYGGSNDLVTGRLAGAVQGSYDVDGGETSVWSPPIVLPSSGTITMSWRYYMAHGDDSSSSDYVRVHIYSETIGDTVRFFNGLGAPENDNAAWDTRSYDISAWNGETVRILIEACDCSGGSLLEAAYDDVRIDVAP